MAERMIEAFIALYKKTIEDDQNQIDSAANDPNSSVNISGLQSSITELKQEIPTLEKFLKKLQDKKNKS